MTTQSSFKVPEISQYPIIKNSDMTAITRQSFDFRSVDSTNENTNGNFGSQDMTYQMKYPTLLDSTTPFKLEETMVII